MEARQEVRQKEQELAKTRSPSRKYTFAEPTAEIMTPPPPNAILNPCMQRQSSRFNFRNLSHLPLLFHRGLVTSRTINAGTTAFEPLHPQRAAHRSRMSKLKPAPIFHAPVSNRAHCPICGQSTYSRDGIHPQCAVKQADDARAARLKLKPKPPTTPASALQKKWSRNCPKCGTQVHVRLAKCACGHVLNRR
jgi:hypothetical protein